MFVALLSPLPEQSGSIASTIIQNRRQLLIRIVGLNFGLFMRR
jgi:hypothetical protein